jgi:hypothetical protein
VISSCSVPFTKLGSLSPCSSILDSKIEFRSGSDGIELLAAPHPPFFTLGGRLEISGSTVCSFTVAIGAATVG